MVVSAAHFANQGKVGADTARNCSPPRWSPGLVGAVRPARSFVFHSHISTPPGDTMWVGSSMVGVALSDSKSIAIIERFHTLAT